MNTPEKHEKHSTQVVSAHKRFITDKLDFLLEGTQDKKVLVEKGYAAFIAYHPIIKESVDLPNEQDLLSLSSSFDIDYLYTQEFHNRRLLVPTLIKLLGTDFEPCIYIKQGWTKGTVDAQAHNLINALDTMKQTIRLKPLDVKTVQPTYTVLSLKSQNKIEELEGVLDLKRAVAQVCAELEVEFVTFIHPITMKEIALIQPKSKHTLRKIYGSTRQSIKQQLFEALINQLEQVKEY